MNPVEESKFRSAVWFAGAVLAFLLVFVFLSWLRGQVQPPPLGHERMEQRLDTLETLRAAADEQLTEYGWSDEARAMVRLPIQRAMELTAREWRDPAAGKAELLRRHQQATIPLHELYE